MNHSTIHLAVVEPSLIVYEGLCNILLKCRTHFQIFKLDTLDEIQILLEKERIDGVIVNPSLIISNKNVFNSIHRNNTGLHWLGLVYSFFEKNVLSQFDDIIQITDSAEQIEKTITRLIKNENVPNTNHNSDNLSSREKDVLVQLVSGLSNKEIADKLNISIHTVISHRKNITQKTGIKSPSGLTIYALSNNIIDMESIVV